MKKNLRQMIRAIAAAITIAICLPVMTMAQGKTFPDVATGEWFYTPVMQASHLGIISGYPNGSFGPNNAVTRSQIVQILYNCYGTDKGTSNKFTDVPANEWYATAVTWAAEEGLVQGTSSTTFSPNNDLTREQMVNILYAKAGRPDVNAYAILASYIDLSDVSSWALSAMGWAVKEGIITGTSFNTLSPKGTTSRAQAAAIVTRYLSKIDDVTLPSINV